MFLLTLLIASAAAIPVMFMLLGGDDDGTAASTSMGTESTTMAGSATTSTDTIGPGKPTTTTAPQLTPDEVAAAEFEADVLLIQNLWQGFSASWSDGLRAGVAYITAHNYPSLTCSSEDWLAYYRDELGWQDGDGEEAMVHADTIERDNNWTWTVPAGYAGAGERPQGRIYVMAVDTTSPTASGTIESHTWSLHSTIIGASAYFFFECA